MITASDIERTARGGLPARRVAAGQGRSVAYTVMRRIFDEGFATGDASVVDQLCSPDLIDHQFGLAGTGAEAITHVKAAIADVRAAVPDIAFTIEDFVEADDTIWVRVRDTATGRTSGRRPAAR